MLSGERTLRHHLRNTFDPFLANPNVRDVVVNRPGQIGVKDATGWTWHDAPELDFERLEEIAILAGYMTSRDVDSTHPLCNSTLPGGQRIQICYPPATSPSTISMAVRRPAQTARRVDDDDFEALFATTNTGPSYRNRADGELIRLYREREWRAFFKLARRMRKTFGFCGSTGSGKTDLLKRLMGLTSERVRIVSIESDAEFGVLGTTNRVSLFYGEDRANIAAEDAVKATLRLIPDEIWLQEIRGAEAFAYLRALAAGHPGGGTSWHAEQGHEFEALELMVRQHSAGNTIPDHKMRMLLRAHLDIVVWCAADGDLFSAPSCWFKAEEDARNE